MNQVWKWLTGDVLKTLGNVVDECITTDEERLKIKSEMEKALMAQSFAAEKLKIDIIQAEAKGNFLQRSWRPILMLGFGFIVMYNKFIAPAFGLPNTVLEADFWNLLQLGIGGYVLGRTGEKITKTIAHNFKLKK